MIWSAILPNTSLRMITLTMMKIVNMKLDDFISQLNQQLEGDVNNESSSDPPEEFDSRKIKTKELANVDILV